MNYSLKDRFVKRVKQKRVIGFVIVLLCFVIFVSKYLSNINIYQPIEITVDGLTTEELNNITFSCNTPLNRAYTLTRVENKWNSINYAFYKNIQISVDDDVKSNISQINIKVGNIIYKFNNEDLEKYWIVSGVKNTYNTPKNVTGDKSIIKRLSSFIYWEYSFKSLIMPLLCIVFIFIIIFIFRFYNISFNKIAIIFYDTISLISYFFVILLNVLFQKIKVLRSYISIRRILKKVLVFFIGIVIFLLIIEISLRIFGYFYQSKEKNGYVKKSNYTVLSIGDSFTYGIGAPEGKDFSSQLQTILNEKTNKKFEVVNRGVPGQNSSEILKNLKSQLEIYKPDLVILLTGGPNARNYWGFGSSFNKFLYRIRIYKLVELLYLNIKQKKINSDNEHNNWETAVENEKNGASHIINRTEDKQSEVYKNAYKQNILRINKEIKKDIDYYNIGTFFIREQNYKESIKWYSRGIINFPDFIKNYEGLAYSYILYAQFIGSNKNVEKVFLNIMLGNIFSFQNDNMGFFNSADKDSCKNNNNNNNNECLFYVNELKNKSKTKFNIVQSQRLDSVINTIPVDYSLGNKLKYYYYSNTQYLTMEKLTGNGNYLIKEWLIKDLEKIIDLCKSHNAKVIMQNYPLPANATFFQPIASNILKTFAKNKSIPFVDNSQIFNDLEKNKQDFFEPINVGDHPNTKGYGLMAKNLFDKIIEIKVFDVDTGVVKK